MPRIGRLLKKVKGHWQRQTREEINKKLFNQIKPDDIARTFKITTRAVQIRAKNKGLEMPVGVRKQERNWEDLMMAKKKKEAVEEKKDEKKVEEEKPKADNKGSERISESNDRGSGISETNDDGRSKLSAGQMDNDKNSNEAKEEDSKFKEDVEKSDLVREKEESEAEVGCENCHNNGVSTALRRGQKRCHECGVVLDW